MGKAFSLFDYKVCKVCGHLYVDDSEIPVCPDCGSEEYRTCVNKSTLQPTKKSPEPIKEQKNTIVYLVTEYGYTKIISKKSKYEFGDINHYEDWMRLYTQKMALLAIENMKAKHPSWDLHYKKVK